jgi:hypothetical protein
LAGRALVRRSFALEWFTLGWNIAGIVVLAFAAITAQSVALAGFGLDSLIEIGASTVVIWELSGTGAERQRHFRGGGTRRRCPPRCRAASRRTKSPVPSPPQVGREPDRLSRVRWPRSHRHDLFTLAW